MLKRIARYIRDHDWFAVVVEVLVVVVGLLLAFQLDGWRDEIVEHKEERAYLEHLIADVETDVPAIEYAIKLQEVRLGLVDLLMEVSRNPEAALDHGAVFIGAIDQAAYTYTPTLTSHTFENLRSTGDLGLIRSQPVKDALFEYYGFDAEQRQYRPLQFSTEFRHFELAAGVLSQEQEVFVQDNWLFFRPDELDEARAADVDNEELLAAATRLQQRPELVAWLPKIRSMQLEQIAVHGSRLNRAHDLLAMLGAYADEISEEPR